MASSPVTIGGIALEQFEVPASITFGGQQKLVIHRLSDGTRAIELLGPDEDEIRFQGTFSGNGAEARARALDSMRLSGSAVTLTWQSFQYLVIIKSFSAHYDKPWWIRYQIGCVVVNQPGVGPAENSMLSLLESDLSSASALVAGSTNLSTLSASVAVDGALTVGTAANAAAYNAGLAALATVNTEIATQTTALVLANQDYTDPTAEAASFASQLSTAQATASAANLRSYLGRICVTLNTTGQ